MVPRANAANQASLVRRKDGQERWIELSVSPLASDSSHARYLLMIVRDSRIGTGVATARRHHGARGRRWRSDHFKPRERWSMGKRA
jgi:hypothetical protein